MAECDLLLYRHNYKVTVSLEGPENNYMESWDQCNFDLFIFQKFIALFLRNKSQTGLHMRHLAVT